MKEKEYLHHQQFDIPGDFLLGLISLAKALASLLKRQKILLHWVSLIPNRLPTGVKCVSLPRGRRSP